MKQITRYEYESNTRLYIENITREIDKNNNVVELCAAYAQYYMYIGTTTHDEYYELTLEEFNAKERELIGDTIYRISEIEFKDIQGFRDKPHLFDIVFYAENNELFHCKIYFFYNENGIFAHSYDSFIGMSGRFKISDNINQFSIDKIVNRLKTLYPNYNINQRINFNQI